MNSLGKNSPGNSLGRRKFLSARRTTLTGRTHRYLPERTHSGISISGKNLPKNFYQRGETTLTGENSQVNFQREKITGNFLSAGKNYTEESTSGKNSSGIFYRSEKLTISRKIIGNFLSAGETHQFSDFPMSSNFNLLPRKFPGIRFFPQKLLCIQETFFPCPRPVRT